VSELPKGWVKTTLGKVVDYGRTEKANSKHISDDTWVLELEDIEKNSSRLLNKSSFLERQPKSSKNAFKVGDVLYGKLRPYLNKIIIASDNGICTSEIIPLRVEKGLVDNRFLFYWLKGIEFSSYVTAVSYGVNMPRLGTKDGKQAPFILAPLAEQKRIVEKLDQVLAQVDTIKARLDGIPNILKRFRQSVLAAAVSGKLTEEWRGRNPTFQSAHLEINKVCISAFDGPFGSKLKTADYTEDGVRVVRLENIGHLEFYDDKKTFVSFEKYESLKRNTLIEGDVLFSSFVDEETRVCVFRFLDGIFVNKADCFCLRPDPSYILSDFLAFMLASHSSYSQIKDRVQGITRPRVNLKILKSLSFNIPSLGEQTEIVRLVDQYFAFADTIEKQVQKAQQRVDRLTQSILAKAFRGELVPQDPTDEPADELLKRIAAARAEAEALAKAAKKVGKKIAEKTAKTLQ
jgi:type I restriction enzyme S subunit